MQAPEPIHSRPTQQIGAEESPTVPLHSTEPIVFPNRWTVKSERSFWHYCDNANDRTNAYKINLNYGWETASTLFASCIGRDDGWQINSLSYPGSSMAFAAYGTALTARATCQSNQTRLQS